jgi:gluconate 2-dehydrogenase gamma chain
MDRRRFLALLSSAVAAAVSSNPIAAFAGQSNKLGTLNKAYTFFTDAESEFIEAAVARLIPADEMGPGALEADVPYFIDQQLVGEYGAGARFYNQGPFGPTTPLQGYQLPLTPRQLYRAGIAATDRYCEEKHGKRFAQLDPAKQDALLKDLAAMAGDKDLKDVPGATFFAHLLGDAKDGFFSDPAYGGNRDLVGWKLIGFPGVPAVYASLIGENKAYNVQPVDMQGAKRVQVNPGQEHHAHVAHPPGPARDTVAPEIANNGTDAGIEYRPSASFSV